MPAPALIHQPDDAAFRPADDQGQSQRMEALGRLALGIAHDFNNLLAVIVNATESLAQGAGDAQTRDLAQTGLEAAERGADLVNRLLAFARKPQDGEAVADAPAALAATARLLQRTLPGDVALSVYPGVAALACAADPVILEAALLNLGINARDAMPSGGRLTLALETANAPANLPAGRYALFTVTDTGVGMSAAVLANAVRPFFTTKGAKGTGLGLAGADGFARDAGGALILISEEGRGTCARLYLPLAEIAR